MVIPVRVSSNRSICKLLVLDGNTWYFVGKKLLKKKNTKNVNIDVQCKQLPKIGIK